MHRDRNLPGRRQALRGVGSFRAAHRMPGLQPRQVLPHRVQKGRRTQ